MAITNDSASINLRYAAAAKLKAAYLQFEALNLVSNPNELAEAEAACAAAIAAIAAVGGGAVADGSTNLLVQSGVEFAAPAIGGAYVNGYTLTIVNGVVTAINAS